MRRNLAEAALDDSSSAGLVDALEVLNAKTSLAHLNRRAADFAAELGSGRRGAGSDAHVPDALGSAYVEMPDFADAAGFLAALRGGVVVGHHLDDARPWSPRIVPSTDSRCRSPNCLRTRPGAQEVHVSRRAFTGG